VSVSHFSPRMVVLDRFESLYNIRLLKKFNYSIMLLLLKRFDFKRFDKGRRHNLMLGEGESLTIALTIPNDRPNDL